MDILGIFVSKKLSFSESCNVSHIFRIRRVKKGIRKSLSRSKFSISPNPYGTAAFATHDVNLGENFGNGMDVRDLSQVRKDIIKATESRGFKQIL